MVNLTHELNFLQEIEHLKRKGQIHDSAGLTPKGTGSKLTFQDAEFEIKWLIATTRQRLNAAKLYLNQMEHINFDYYLSFQVSSEPEKLLSKDFINYSDDIIDIQIKLIENNNTVHRETSALLIFTVLNGFFSNLVSLEDCVAKFINIIYDLHQDDRESHKIRQKLVNKLPNGKLTEHLRTFHAINQDGNRDKTGSSFNIVKEIRNQLIHDDIDSVLHPLSALSCLTSDSKLHFYNSFFPINISPSSPTTEVITFSKDVFEKTVNFVDVCYRLICDDLQQSGVLPV